MGKNFFFMFSILLEMYIHNPNFLYDRTNMKQNRNHNNVIHEPDV